MRLEMHHGLAGQPEAVRVKTQAELCCCKPVYMQVSL